MKHQVQQRQSNFELLRIIAMLMIVAAHLAAHGVEHMNREDAYVIWNAGSMINKIFSCFLIGGDRPKTLNENIVKISEPMHYIKYKKTA